MTTIYFPLDPRTGEPVFGPGRAPIESRYCGAAALESAIRDAAALAPEFRPVNPRTFPDGAYSIPVKIWIPDVDGVKCIRAVHGPVMPEPAQPARVRVEFHYSTPDGARGSITADNLAPGLLALAAKIKRAAGAYDGKTRRAPRPKAPASSAPHVAARQLWKDGEFSEALALAQLRGAVFFGNAGKDRDPLPYMNAQTVDAAGNSFTVARCIPSGAIRVLHTASALSVDGAEHGAPAGGFRTHSAALDWLQDRASDDAWCVKLNRGAERASPFDQSAALAHYCGADGDAAAIVPDAAPESTHAAANDATGPDAPEPAPAAPSVAIPADPAPVSDAVAREAREARDMVESFYDATLRGYPGETIPADVIAAHGAAPTAREVAEIAPQCDAEAFANGAIDGAAGDSWRLQRMPPGADSGPARALELAARVADIRASVATSRGEWFAGSGEVSPDDAEPQRLAEVMRARVAPAAFALRDAAAELEDRAGRVPADRAAEYRAAAAILRADAAGCTPPDAESGATGPGAAIPPGAESGAAPAPRAPRDGDRFRMFERSRASDGALWECLEVCTARRAADVAQTIIAGYTSGERWAVCADTGALLYGIGADGRPMSAAPCTHLERELQPVAAGAPDPAGLACEVAPPAPPPAESGAMPPGAELAPEVAAMVEECRARVAGDPRPKRGLQLQAAACRKRADGMRQGIAKREAPADFLQAWAINGPRNAEAADALEAIAAAIPDPPAPTREHSGHEWDTWAAIGTGRADPDEYCAHVLECYGSARAQLKAAGRYPYNADAWPLAAAMMAERYGYPDAREPGALEGVARAFGSNCYSAGEVIRAREKAAAEKAAADGLRAGQKFARLIFSDGKLCTGAVLESFTHTGAECRLTGKRAGRPVEINCTATSLLRAAERAAERSELHAQRRKRARPAPVPSVESDAAHKFAGGRLSAAELGGPLRPIAGAGDAAAEPRTVPAEPYASDTHERPCAAPGLTSYRARGTWGWIMIGATDDADAMREAMRSTHAPTNLQRWDGSAYVPCGPTAPDLGARILATIGGRDAGTILTAKGYAQALAVSEADAAHECERLAAAGQLARFDYSRQGFPPGFALPYVPPTADPPPVESAPPAAESGPAPIARPGRVFLMLHNALVPVQNAAPDGVPTVAGLESEAARIEASGEAMRDVSPQYAAECAEVARNLREMADAERARLADAAPCKHPPARLFAGHARNADGIARPWVACCDCGAVLAGGAQREPDPPPAGAPWPASFARAYSTARAAASRRPGPPVRIPDADPRARIPDRFAPVYCLRGVQS